MAWGPITTVPAPDGLTRGAAASTGGGNNASARVTQPMNAIHRGLKRRRSVGIPFLRPAFGECHPVESRRRYIRLSINRQVTS
jgi:hypothetical protein